MRCLFCKLSCIYLKEQKEWILSSPKNAVKWPRVKRELFPSKKYQNPSQCDYKMLVVSHLVKIVWTDAAYLLKNSLLTLAPTNISNPHF